jgi:hypothetical protein
MKHLIKNNEIVRSGIPSHFTRENGEGFWGGYETRTDLHHEDGWRDEVVPEYDPVTEQLGSPFYSEELDAVTYEVAVRLNLPSLEEAKSRKVAEIKHQAGNKLSQTDWFVTRQVETGKPIPEGIAEERELIRDRSNELEAEVMAIAELRDVLVFEVIY